MGTELVKAVESGFAEFAALLITETLDGVVSSLLAQEQKLRELEEAILLQPDQFAARYLDNGDIRREILGLFPAAEGRENVSAVDAGQPYRFPRQGVTEEPPILDRCGYTVTKEDLEKSGAGLVFSAAGAGRIALAIASRMAQIQQESLRLMVQRGIPRVFVDNGRITAKFTLKLEQAVNVEPRKKGGLTSLFAGGRLRVNPVSTRGPEFLSLKSDITSEIEICFKTITS